MKLWTRMQELHLSAIIMVTKHIDNELINKEWISCLLTTLSFQIIIIIFVLWMCSPFSNIILCLWLFESSEVSIWNDLFQIVCINILKKMFVIGICILEYLHVHNFWPLYQFLVHQLQITIHTTLQSSPNTLYHIITYHRFGIIICTWLISFLGTSTGENT